MRTDANRGRCRRRKVSRSSSPVRPGWNWLEFEASISFRLKAEHLIRRTLARVMRAMCGREEIRRGGLSSKEQAVVDGCGEHGALMGLSWKGVRIGAAGEGIMRPARFP